MPIYIGNTKVKLPGISKVYIGNSLVWNKTRLPIEYQEVEWIESTGTQGIITNRVFSTTDKIEIDYESYATYNGMWNFGSQELSKRFGTYRNTGLALLFGGTTNVYTSVFDSSRHKEKYENYKYYRDGVDTGLSLSTTEWSGTYPIALFGTSAGETSMSYGRMKLYSYNHYKNNVKVLELIPCYRKSDNVIGLYDLVNSGKNLFDMPLTSTSIIAAAPATEHATLLTNTWYIAFAYNGYANASLITSITTTGDKLTFTSTNASYAPTKFVSLKPSTTYTINCKRNGNSGQIACMKYTKLENDKWKWNKIIFTPYNGSKTFTTDADDGVECLYGFLIYAAGANVSTTITDLQLEEGSSATTYERHPLYTNIGSGVFTKGQNK